MKKLYEYPPKLHIPNLRRALLLLHTDLLAVHQKIVQYAAYWPQSLTNLEKLVLVLEDRRFMQHHGIDAKSVMREIFRAVTFRRHGGASTIDMQLVRTATGYHDLTLRRKLYECLLAYIIQFRYSKITILRSYLSCAYFGAGLRGAERASQKIFGKPSDALSISEASFIAAMLVYPRPSGGGAKRGLRVKRRANYGEGIYVANKERFDKLPG